MLTIMSIFIQNWRMKMPNSPEYIRKHKIERHFWNRKYYYSHKYLWQKNKNLLGSEATQRIYDSDIEKSKDYIHNYAEYLRHYKSPINRNKSDKSLLNDINESND